MSGCGQTGEQDTIDKLFTYLRSGEYPRIYKLLTNKAKAAISLVDFNGLYSDVYGMLALTKTECGLKGVTGTAGGKSAAFTMTMTTDKLGAFKLEMNAPLVWEDNEWRIDWTRELILPGLVKGDKVCLNTDPANRGEIFDANGEVLATNAYAVSVYVDTALVKDYETIIRMLAPVLGMTEKAVRDRLKSAMIVSGVIAASPALSASPTPTPTPTQAASPEASPEATAVPSVKYTVRAYPKDALTEEQRTAIGKIQGVGIDDSSLTKIRIYPYGSMMAQTLGYTSVMQEADLKKPENAGLPKDAIIGRVGLEAAFEQELRGTPGYSLVIKDSNSAEKSVIARKSGSDGKDLRLTIDIRLQQEAEMLLRENLTQQMAGTIIVTNPKTGYIEAIAGAPSFDPNIFSFPVSDDVYKTLKLLNRATEGRYAPGSTFKPFTASMALSDGVLDTNDVFPYEITNDQWIPGEKFGIMSKITRSETTQGALNMKNAITYSDNIYFAWAALKIGADNFYKHCLDMGFTKSMPFDLPLSIGKISNTNEIKDQRTLADSGYGQGELQFTPVQMAMSFGALANSGDIMVPRIVQRICHVDGAEYVTDRENPREVWLEKAFPEQNVNKLIPYLKTVAEKGTAKGINAYKDLRSYEICAKTGTAEIGNDKTREIAWLIAFTTKKRDRLVCLTLEVPADKGTIRVDIAKQVLYASSTPEVYAAAEAKEQDNQH